MTSRSTNTNRDTVVGLFRTPVQAERAIRELKSAGFADHEIGVLMQDPEAGRRLAEDTGTKAGEGAKAGAIGGGVVGGVLGLLAGVGALAIPGIGPIVAGGALASTLAGAGIGAATGGLIGALTGMGVPEDEARFYEQGLQQGGILLTVDAGGRRAEAERILGGASAEFGGAGRVRAAETAAVHDDVTAANRRVTDRGRVRDTVRREEARVEEANVESGVPRGTGEEAWRGNERRYRSDPSYAGPERRMVGI